MLIKYIQTQLNLKCLHKQVCIKYKARDSERVNSPGPYFEKVKIILSLTYKINLIFYLIKEFMKHSCLNFFYGIVNKISIEIKRN